MTLSSSVPIRHIGTVPKQRIGEGWHGYAWWAAFVGAGPGRIFYHLFNLNAGPWLPIVETLFLVCLAGLITKVPKHEKLSGFILLIAAAHFSWDVLVPWIEASTVTHSIYASVGWAGQFFLSRTIRLVGIPLLCLTLLGSGIGVRDLFLGKGDWRQPVQPEPILPFKRPVT